MEKTTTLYQKHLSCGAKMVPFAGYMMPVQYTAGVIAEHMAVRSAAGLFDVSHMGEVMLSGPLALGLVQKLLTNDYEDLEVGGCRYGLMCNEQGGVVDDLIVYRTAEDAFMLVVNAANHDKDIAWIQARVGSGVKMDDISDATAELALQGPNAQAILAGLVPGGSAALPSKYYTFVSGVRAAGVECLISRTGYTGEDGFELYCGAEDAPALWDALLEAGAGMGLIPCGLGARDTLRLEAGMPLYGHEMNEDITPQEAVLGVFVKLDKPSFIGKAAMLEKGPPSRRRSALRMTGRGIARENAPVYHGDVQVGYVTSGTMLPFLGWAGAMAMLNVAYREAGTKLEVEVRGKRIECEVIKTPFYKRA